MAKNFWGGNSGGNSNSRSWGNSSGNVTKKKYENYSSSWWDDIYSWRPKKNTNSVVSSQIDTTKLKTISSGIRQRHQRNDEEKKAMGMIDNYMIEDMYDIFYSKGYTIKLKEDLSNWWWYKILSKFDNYQLKPLTSQSNIFSYMVTNHMVDHLIEMFKEMPPEEMKKDLQKNAPESGEGEGEGEGQGGQGEGEGQEGEGSGDGDPSQGAGKGESSGKQSGTNSTPQQGPEAGGNLSQQKSQNPGKCKAEKLAEDTAKKAMDSLQDYLDKNKESIKEYEDYQKDAGNEEGNIDFAEMERLKELNNQIGLNKHHIDQFVKQSIKNFTGYFDSMSKSQTESMLDADVITDLIDMELAIIDPIFIDLVDNKFFSSKKKFNCYIDVLIQH